MPSNDPVLELAIFTVKPGCEAQMPVLRQGLREALRGFAGLLDYQGYSPIGEGRVFADLAQWSSLEHAQTVAEAFASGDPRFAPYAEAIESIAFMEHFRPE